MFLRTELSTLSSSGLPCRQQSHLGQQHTRVRGEMQINIIRIARLRGRQRLPPFESLQIVYSDGRPGFTIHRGGFSHSQVLQVGRDSQSCDRSCCSCTWDEALLPAVGVHDHDGVPCQVRDVVAFEPVHRIAHIGSETEATPAAKEH